MTCDIASVWHAISDGAKPQVVDLAVFRVIDFNGFHSLVRTKKTGVASNQQLMNAVGREWDRRPARLILFFFFAR